MRRIRAAPRALAGRLGIAVGLASAGWWAAPATPPQGAAVGVVRGPASATPSGAAPGAVSGTVRLAAPPATRPPMLSPYARPRYRPPARAEVPAGSPETVVVYLRSDAPVTAAPRAVARITQRDRTILPHVTPIRTGTEVLFPNEDDVFHNIFSLSGPKRFNLGRYPPGESRAEVFERPGIVRLFCDIHSEMGGVIVVLDTPWFTQPDGDGRFRIEGVPEGEYTAIAWHELAGTDSARVVVPPRGEASVDFTLGG